MQEEVSWLSTREAAGQLGITTRTLYRLIDSGQLPAYKFGRVIRLKAHEVEAFVEAAWIVPGELEHLDADVTHADEESRSSDPSGIAVAGDGGHQRCRDPGASLRGGMVPCRSRDRWG